MTGLTSTYFISGAGDDTVIVRSKFTKRDGTAPIAFYCHGNAGNAMSGLQDGAGQIQLVRALAEAGYVTVLPNMGGSLWANPSVLTYLDSAITAAQGAPFYGRTGKVLMTGISMGGLSALVYAGRNPTKVSGVIAIEPVTDLTDAITQFPTGINAAYGGAYSDATYGANHNPIRMAEASKFAGMPVRMWYGNTDTIAKPELVLALDAAIKAKASPDVKTDMLIGGHNDAVTAQVPMSDIRDFGLRCLPVST